MATTPDLSNFMKQAQEVQTRVRAAQREMASLEVQGESGAGLVKITITGQYDVKRVEIDPSLIGEGKDKEMLEDLIAAAFRNAVQKIEAKIKDKMAGLTTGLPFGQDFPFDAEKQ